MKEIKVSIQNEFNEKLIGIETIPSVSKSKYPTVILAHGFAYNKEETGGMFSDIAKNLSSAGILVYRFDFSGCGESEGDYSETSLSKLKSDLSKILEFVQSQSKVDNSRIGILGQSFGTATAITLEPKVKCLIMMGSVAHPKEILAELFGKGYSPEGISTRVKPNGVITKIKPQFWKDFENHNLLESIKNIHCLILFIHGSKDDKVPVADMESYFQNTNEPKEKVVIDGGDHGLRPHRDKMYKIVVDWFNKYLV
ncbi:MAG: alpha/beta hydrolase [Candidatus Aenigmarchaeota archaeon]|nr:alpha/beta hydrolase [Candidatus Aenigmarchaeota archaeon]